MSGVDSSYGHCDVQLQRDTNHHHQVRVLAESRHVRGHSDEDHRDVRRVEEGDVTTKQPKRKGSETAPLCYMSEYNSDVIDEESMFTLDRCN